jgi:hypothetical protein
MGKTNKAFTALIGALVLSGCASTIQKVPVADYSNLAKGNALIKVHRLYDLHGSGVHLELKDNGTVVGELGADGLVAWQRPAGQMVLTVSHSYSGNPLVVNVEAGREYEISIVTVDGPWKAGVEFQQQ